MGDRAQRVKGMIHEARGRARRDAGAETGRHGTEARGAAEELRGRIERTVGRARSAAKKKTR